MMNLFLFITIIFLFNGCQKQDIGTVPQYDEDFKSVPDTVLVDFNDNAGQPEPERSRTIQEIIEWYAVTSTAQKRGLFAFQIEGNFTGSGNREIIAFYSFFSIHTAFCFVLDSNEERIESVFQIKGVLITDEMNEEVDLPEVLGRPIIWRDRKIGCIGDFNMNGREEVFLYSESLIGKRLRIFEFGNTGFADILDLNVAVNSFFTSIDQDEKIINIRLEYPCDGTPFLNVENNSYKWEEATHRYELLTSELKKYRWNSDIRDYEEIE